MRLAILVLALLSLLLHLMQSHSLDAEPSHCRSTNTPPTTGTPRVANHPHDQTHNTTGAKDKAYLRDGCVGSSRIREEISTKDPILKQFANSTRWLFHHWRDWTRGARCERAGGPLVVHRLVPSVRTKRTPKKKFKRQKQRGNEWNVIRNVCFSRDGGVYGQGVAPAGEKISLRNEFKEHEYRFPVFRLPFVPKCYIDKTVHVHLMNVASNNLGHATTRAMGFRRAARHMTTEHRSAFNFSAPAALTVFLTMNAANFTAQAYRPYLSLLTDAWISVPYVPARLRRVNPNSLVCFKEAVFAMMAPLHWADVGTRERFVNNPHSPHEIEASRAYGALQHSVFHDDYVSLRDDMLRCMAVAVRPSGPAAWATRVQVTWVGRRNRHVDGEHESFRRLAEEYGGRHYSFRFVYLEQLSYAAQVAVVANTDILMGAHGAGLAWLYLLRPGSVVVEVEPWMGAHFKQFLSCAPRGVNTGAYCPFGHITFIMGGITHIVEHAPPLFGRVNISSPIVFPFPRLRNAFHESIRHLGNQTSATTPADVTIDAWDQVVAR